MKANLRLQFPMQKHFQTNNLSKINAEIITEIIPRLTLRVLRLEIWKAIIHYIYPIISS